MVTTTSIISPHTKMADVIHKDYLLLPVINRFGIQLGFGDKTVEQVCSDYKINPSFFLDIINTYHDEYYFPMEKMQLYPVDMIIDYLLKTHEYYKKQALPEIELKIERVKQSCSVNCENFDLIEEFYRKYKEELLFHLDNEEEKFFPYIKALAQQEHNIDDLNNFRKKYAFSYDVHSDEHENVQVKLLDLKNIIIKYLPPHYDQGLGNDLLSSLFVFEKDINDHERLEDVILLPALQRIEQKIEHPKE